MRVPTYPVKTRCPRASPRSRAARRMGASRRSGTLLPACCGLYAGNAARYRLFREAGGWIAHTGAPGRPWPAEYGQEHAVDHRYAARCDRGLGARRMQSAQDDPDLSAARLDSLIARAPKRLRRITTRSRDAHSHRSRFPVAGAGTGRDVGGGGGLAMDAGHPVRRHPTSANALRLAGGRPAPPGLRLAPRSLWYHAYRPASYRRRRRCRSTPKATPRTALVYTAATAPRTGAMAFIDARAQTETAQGADRVRRLHALRGVEPILRHAETGVQVPFVAHVILPGTVRQDFQHPGRRAPASQVRYKRYGDRSIVRRNSMKSGTPGAGCGPGVRPGGGAAP